MLAWIKENIILIYNKQPQSFPTIVLAFLVISIPDVLQFTMELYLTSRVRSS